MYPPKFNMEPDNNGFQKDFPFKGLIFRFHVISGGVAHMGVLDLVSIGSSHRVEPGGRQTHRHPMAAAEHNESISPAGSACWFQMVSFYMENPTDFVCLHIPKLVLIESDNLLTFIVICFFSRRS